MITKSKVFASLVSTAFTFVTATGCDVETTEPATDRTYVEPNEAQVMLADVDAYMAELMSSPDLAPVRTSQADDCTGLHCDAVGSDSLVIEDDVLAQVAAPALLIYFVEGNAVWAWGTTSSVIIGTGAPPAAISLQVMAGEATIASTMAQAAANPGTIYGVVADGTYVAGSMGSGGTATGAAGGTLAGTVGILAVAVVIAVGATIAIDCAMHDGECIWTTVNNAGGWGVVLGTAPNPNAAPSGLVTVSCYDPTPRITQCKNSSLKNVITHTSSWFGGSYWTCGDLWADEAAGNISSSQVAALNSCNAQANQCVTDTNNVCGGAAPLPVPVPAQDAPALPAGGME